MISTFTTAMSSALGTMVTDVTSAIGTLAPVVLPVMAGVLGIMIVFKLAKRFTKQGA